MSSQVPKSSGKAPLKSISASKHAKKTRKKAIDPTTGVIFKSAVKKCVKECVPDGSVTITRNALCILCGIAEAVLEDISRISCELANKVKKKTIGGEDVSSACELLMIGELRNLCVREVRNTVTKFNQQKAAK
ncbi:HTB1 [Ecytonucleospora hepatopenaei]|uniref:HTB1 n=1 Tax=Ecytonucleospora hepatopenaei TaxID=646526 RepID=A0A1W0E4T4_9MICR|nr:HTB1 [Ecytonucleospora hepatopenaei]